MTLADALNPRQDSAPGGERCEHTGLSKPECSCRHCTGALIHRHQLARALDAAATMEWRSTVTDEPLLKGA